MKMDNLEKSKTEARLFPKESLVLHPDIPGARMWAVALKHAMLTYFEVEKHTRFERHSHESEQITHVLQGILYFELDGKTIPVKEGDVIALPANVIHAAYTKGDPVKAVDAWSPVMTHYRGEESSPKSSS